MPLLLILALIITVVVFLWQQTTTTARSEVPYGLFFEQVREGNVKDLHYVDRQIVRGTWKKAPTDAKSGQPFKDQFSTILPPADDPELLPLLRKEGIEIKADKLDSGLGMGMMLVMVLPVVALMAFLWFMMRRTADPMGGMMGGFIRSPAKRFQPSDQQNTFADVAGMEQPKHELQEIVEFLKDASKFERLGARIPKGVLLMGPPGTGKTLLARATAGEAGVPFFSINGSEFIQMFVGVGASRVRDMFKTAKESAPCILFIDEIDAVGRVRGAGFGGGHDEREQTLNQILSEMDGFQQTESVIVLAATNRPDVLDPALLRPGRFDRHVTIDRPTKAGRLGVLKVHTRKVPLSDTVDLEMIAAGTIGFAGADLKNLVNEAALEAARLGKNAVDRHDFDYARDKVLMGAKREEILNEHEKEMTAYHEAGHALLAWLLPETDTVFKVTIIPRGRALGVTQLVPEEERYSVGEKRLHDQLVMMLGGRAAEKMIFNEYTAGAEDDLKRATQLARRMVGHWGMSEVIGPVAFRQGEEHPFLGKEIHEMREFSEETARIIDQEGQRFLIDAADRATKMLTTSRDKLDLIAKGLLEKEMLDQDDIRAILGAREARVFTRKPIDR